MKKKIFIFLLIFNLSIISAKGLFSQDIDQDNKKLKRISLIIGCNKGGKGRVKLKYAVSDARNMSKILGEMGGIIPEDNIILGNPGRELLLQTFLRLKNKVNSMIDQYKVEVIIYYSGHSDAEGLLLGAERVSYQELKKAIAGLRAEVRIAILDSCSSGAFTRVKGGKKKAAFLMDNAYNMKGYAVMTSSSSDEASQESENLQGSFFTHNLVAGLRGAADMSGDQRVTLSEAYQYAFNETLSQTTNTLSGPQHPNYNIEMSGTGDVVMTDLRKYKTLLVLDKKISGKIFIHDVKNYLILEFRKQAGKAVSIGLDEGKHRITVNTDKKTTEAFVDLKKKKPSIISAENLRHTNRVVTSSRGIQKIKKKKLRIFFELNLNSLKTNNIAQTLVGAYIGIVLKNNMMIGIGGFGNSFVVNVPDELEDKFTIGSYGGFLLGYEFFSKKKINVQFTTLWGVGTENKAKKLDFFDDNFEFSSENIKPFFIVEPAVSAILNLNKSIKFKFSISYKLIDNTNSVADKLSIGGGIHFRF